MVLSGCEFGMGNIEGNFGSYIYRYMHVLSIVTYILNTGTHIQEGYLEQLLALVNTDKDVALAHLASCCHGPERIDVCQVECVGAQPTHPPTHTHT